MSATDQNARARAIDPQHSFIVQAPAGSGKTELLTQRFLCLLATVEQPEQVLAITFTRKATQEMRERIMLRLEQAYQGVTPKEEHIQTAIAFAREVLARDQEKSWNLRINPGRLQIHTIDGLCARISSRNTLTENGLLGITAIDDARPLYQLASQRLLEDLGKPSKANRAYDALLRTLTYLHGNSLQFIELIAGMLSRRDQWLNQMTFARTELKSALASRQVLEWDYLHSALGSERISGLGGQLQLLSTDADDLDMAREFQKLFATSEDIHSDPDAAVRQLLAILRTVATKANTPFSTRSVGKNLIPGSGADRGDQLGAIKDILECWYGDEHCKEAFKRFLSNPPMEDKGGQFQLLDDLRLLLKIATAELNVLFVEKGQADFLYFADAALQALGDDAAPGEALLIEDCKLVHVLMDEFQDTSYGQFQLISRLVSGWQPGDGRSLFLVGDPMQSIYRFRQADVGLYKKVVAEQTLGDVSLECLELSSNFRSNEEIINWVNDQFSRIFSASPGPGEDAVAYVPVHSEKPAGGKVTVLTRNVQQGPEHEAEQIAEIISRKQSENPKGEIAVLARKRKQLILIADSLKKKGIPFEAVQVEALATRPVIQDLLCFTRAILHPGDRIAWLGLLRGPWCGLDVASLQLLAGEDSRSDLYARMNQSDVLDELPVELASNVQMLRSVMGEVNALNGKLPISRLVEFAWLQSRAVYASGSQLELENAQSYFRLLSAVERENPDDFLGLLMEELKKLYSSSGNAHVKLMTIHKAKGLEFDTVILPGLNEIGAGADRPLLRIQQIHDDHLGSVLIAPIKRRGFEGSSLYDYLGLLDKEADINENQRTLYVAATRAKRELYVSGSWGMKGSGAKRAPGCDQRSFMNMLWPVFEEIINPDEAEVVEKIAPEIAALPLLRLKGTPDPSPTEKREAGHDVELRIADRDAVALGEALHLWLELIHDHWSEQWSEEWFDLHGEALSASLLRAGAAESELDELMQSLKAALNASISPEAGDSPVIPDVNLASLAEVSFISRDGNLLRKNTLDLLRQKTDGTFSIVDYKTGGISNQVKESWSKQLESYRSIVEAYTGGSVSEVSIFHAEQGKMINSDTELG